MIYQNINYNSPTMLKAFLEFHNMAMQKKFGQNFLVNEHARKKLTDALELSSGTRVWEIGPGLGALTQCVLQRGAKLTAFEIDRGFSAILTDIFKDEILAEQFTLIQGNVLKTWKAESEKFVPERLCGNLPYNIAAVLIADMISASVRFERAVLTVQKEVAVRMSAKPKTADYSSFSVLCQWAYDISTVMDLSGGNFWPRPNVDSRAVLMTKKADFPCCKSSEHFLKLHRAVFSCRRKTIKNNLIMFYGNGEKAEDILQTAHINPKCRAEELDIDTLLHLSDISFDNGGA